MIRYDPDGNEKRRARARGGVMDDNDDRMHDGGREAGERTHPCDTNAVECCGCGDCEGFQDEYTDTGRPVVCDGSDNCGCDDCFNRRLAARDRETSPTRRIDPSSLRAFRVTILGESGDYVAADADRARHLAALDYAETGRASQKAAYLYARARRLYYRDGEQSYRPNDFDEGPLLTPEDRDDQ